MLLTLFSTLLHLVTVETDSFSTPLNLKC
jgi:hypothetical protein